MEEEKSKSVTTIKDGFLSHCVNVLRLPPKGQTVKIVLSEEQSAAVVLQLGIVSVEKLETVLLVKRWHKDGVRVSGPLKAELTQSCVVTLAAVTEQIRAEINAVFVPSTSKLAKPEIAGEANELIIDPDGDDLPELFEPPELDVGAVVVEFLALEINPYPKSEKADAKAADLTSKDIAPTESARENPFAALAALKDKL